MAWGTTESPARSEPARVGGLRPWPSGTAAWHLGLGVSRPSQFPPAPIPLMARSFSSLVRRLFSPARLVFSSLVLLFRLRRDPDRIAHASGWDVSPSRERLRVNLGVGRLNA